MFERIRNRLVDKLALLVWEGICRRGLRLEPPGELIRLGVGKTEGAVKDLRYVEFHGERLAQSQDSAGNVRIQEALYRTLSGELLVHIRVLEKSAGFPTVYSLYAVEEADLVEGGLHEELGKARSILPLTEALGGSNAVRVGHDTGH